MTKIEQHRPDPPGVYKVESPGWPVSPKAEGAQLTLDRRLVGVVRRCYHYPAAALLVLYVQTFRAVPSIAALVDELIEPLRPGA